MCSSPDNEDGTGAIRESNFKPIAVPPHVENDDVAWKKAGRDIPILYSLRCLPFGALRIGEPVTNPVSTVRMLPAKRLEHGSPNYSHAGVPLSLVAFRARSRLGNVYIALLPIREQLSTDSSPGMGCSRPSPMGTSRSLLRRWAAEMADGSARRDWH